MSPPTGIGQEPYQHGRVRMLLLDDHGLFREGLSRLLADEPDVEVCAQCSSVDELGSILAAAPASEPPFDLLLLDFDLGEQNGFDALRTARALGFRGSVLLVTAGMSPAAVDRAYHEGVAGVFLKHRPPGDLLQAIRHVMRGEPWPGQAAVTRLLRGVEAESLKGPPQPLTARERAVLRGVFEGHANKEIAGELLVSEGSVKAVLQQLFAKTGVRSRAQLVRIALEHRYEYQLEIG